MGSISEDDVTGAVGNRAGPVIEGLAVVLLEIRAALLHLDEGSGFPDRIIEGDAASSFGGPGNADHGIHIDTSP